MTEEIKNAEGSQNVAPEAKPVQPETVAQKSETNVFTELFGGDKVAETPNLMQGVIKQEESKSKSFLGRKPEITEKKTVNFTVKRSKPGSLVLKIAVFALIACGGWFFSQNAQSFTLLGENLAIKHANAELSVKEVNAELAIQKHLEAFLLLLEYNDLTDQYFYNLNQSKSSYVSQNKKTEAELKVVALKAEVLENLKKIKSDVATALTEEEKSLAIIKLDEDIAALHAQSGNADQQSLLRDVSDLESTKKLILNAEFVGFLQGLELEKIKDEDLQKIMDYVNQLNQSPLALINTIKAKKTIWSAIIEQLEGVTKSVDPLFGTEFAGSLSFSDIQLDSKAKTISVTGDTNTDDTKNFTLVSNLIDAYEASSLFKNAEERNFSKSGGSSATETEEAQKYQSSFRISLELE